MKYFRESIIVTIIALIIAVVYGGVDALILATILGIMEVSLSFDNAIVNARILERMSHRWRNIFLTVGMLIAVLGMRFIFPLAVVSVSAQMSPMKALHLAMEKGNPETVGTYGYILQHAHPVIAAFGGAFLLMASTMQAIPQNTLRFIIMPTPSLHRAICTTTEKAA